VALLVDTATHNNGSGDLVKNSKAGYSCSTYGGDKNCTQGLSKETAGKEPRWKTKHKWQDDIKIDIKKHQILKSDSTPWISLRHRG